MSQKWKSHEGQGDQYKKGGQSAWHVAGNNSTRNNLAWKRLEEVSYTVFVDNLPTSMSKSWLWQLFGYEGKVVDVILSWKKRKNNQQPFAFVRFAKLHEAKKAINNLNDVDVRGCKIKVSLAEYRRKMDSQKDRFVNMTSNWTRKMETLRDGTRTQGKSYKDAILDGNRKGVRGGKEAPARKIDAETKDEGEKYERTTVVYGDVDKDMAEELSRSFIGETLCPIDIELMEAKLRGTFLPIESVRTMGAYKVLITFPSKEDMEETMKERGNLLSEYFDKLRVWSEEEVCQTRTVVWVECLGMPLQAWSAENFRKIAAAWGTVVRVDDQTSNRSSFSSAKILIDTCYYPFIQGNVYFLVEVMGTMYMSKKWRKRINCGVV